MDSQSDNILVVKFGALGDVVRTAYMLPALAEKYPKSRICWLTSDDAYDLLRFNPFISRLASPALGYRKLNDLRFRCAISLDDEPEILARLSTLKVERIIGARLEGNKRTYCKASAGWFDMGLISRFGKGRADELKRLNRREHHTFLEEMVGIRIEKPSFYNSTELEAKAAVTLGYQHFHIGINSGAGARWPAKQLRLEETCELIRHLVGLRIRGKPTKVWLLGGPSELRRHQAICAAIASEGVADLGLDHDLLEFAAYIRALDYLITSDSLALHLGIAQGVHNLSFYAPTSAAEIGTFGSGVKVLSTSADYCSYRPDADNRSITADRIWDAFQAQLTAIGLLRAK